MDEMLQTQQPQNNKFEKQLWVDSLWNHQNKYQIMIGGEYAYLVALCVSYIIRVNFCKIFLQTLHPPNIRWTFKCDTEVEYLDVLVSLKDGFF